jgi:hypothetical protein
MVQFNRGQQNFFIKFYTNCIFLSTIQKVEVLYFYHTATKNTKFDLKINYFLTGSMVQFSRGQHFFSGAAFFLFIKFDIIPNLKNNEPNT